jgi:hypothetical protein
VEQYPPTAGHAGWSAVLAVPRDVDRALASPRELPGHA